MAWPYPDIRERLDLAHDEDLTLHLNQNPEMSSRRLRDHPNRVNDLTTRIFFI